MKNEKLNLSELRVKSFVTDFRNGAEDTIKGGTETLTGPCSYDERSIFYCRSYQCEETR